MLALDVTTPECKNPWMEKVLVVRSHVYLGVLTSRVPLLVFFVITKSSSITVAYPDIQIRRGGGWERSFRPRANGGGNPVSKNFFLALRASVLVRNKGGRLPPRPRPLPRIRQCINCLFISPEERAI